jgi:Protein of unknown function (DUF3485)
MKQLLTYLTVVVVVAAGTGAHGYVTGRWSSRGPQSELVMPAIPEISGNWRGEAMKSGITDEANLRNITRKYTHARTGRVLTVSLTLGPAGLTAQHTPEYCYTGSGYKEIGQTQLFAAPGRTNETGGFRTAAYRKERGGIESLRIYWAWSADGNWSSPKVPELAFLTGSLYKLYVVSWNADLSPEQDSELQDFMTELMKTLQTSLFSPEQR